MGGASESLRLALAFYFLLLALTAALGIHQPLLAYPFKIVYSAVRLTVGTVTLGRVNLVPMGRRVQRRGARRVRDWRYTLQDWRDQRAEKNGRDPMAGGWAAASETRNYDAVPDAQSSMSSAAETVTVMPYDVASIPEPAKERETLERKRSLFYDDQEEEEMPPPFVEAGPVAPSPPATPPSSSSLASLWDDDEEDDLPPPLE